MTQQEFDILVPSLRAQMYSIGYDFFGNNMDAEDVAQDGLVTLWRYYERIETDTQCKSLAIKIAKHCCINTIRKKKETLDINNYNEDLVPPGSEMHQSPEKDMLSKELKKVIDIAIDHLNPSERRLFLMRQLDGLTLNEICEQTGIQKTSVKSMIAVARRKIYDELSRYTEITSKMKCHDKR